MKKAYKFRIYPTPEQTKQIQRTFGSCRFVYNHFLAKSINDYKESKTTISYYDYSATLTELKKELTWLRESDSTALLSSLKNLDTAYKNFFTRIKKGGVPGFPRFKSKKNRRQSYKAKTAGKNIAVFESYIKLPKLGMVRSRVSMEVRGRILNATVSQTPSGKYFVSLCCTDVDIPQHGSTNKTVGLDMGIKDLVITSNDETYPNHKYIKQSEKKLAKAQRQLSRKPIGSANREKARIKVARIQERTANQRTDTLHKLTTGIVRSYDVICIEDLAPKNMMQNRRLSKSIADVSWGELTRQLEYKCAWQHKALVKVGRFFASSQTCGHCGKQNPEVKSLGVRQWRCPTCGTNHDRDKNAAQNILNEGLRLLGT